MHDSCTILSDNFFIYIFKRITIMQTMLLQVVKSGDAFTVKSEKSENGELKKRNLVLKELGGKYESHYVVTALGEQAEQELKAGDLVFATMRFQSREYNGQTYQDIIATELIKK